MEKSSVVTIVKKFEKEYDFLSNSYPSTFVFEKIKYKNVSQAYYSLKAKHSSDAQKIREFKNASEAIKFGKSVEAKDNWQLICKQIMKDLLMQKFDNPFLSKRLIETKNIILGDGRNFVGELLMEIRKELIKNYDNNND